MKAYLYLILIPLTVIIFSCSTASREKSNDGTRIQRKYNQMGKLEAEISHINGVKHGPAKYYYDNESLQYLIHYKDGKKHGESTWYYEDGNVYQVTPFIKGEEHGIKKKYYPSGKLMSETPYKNGEQQPGLKEYTEEGKLVTTYPEIVFEKPYLESTGNRFTLKIHLSNNSKEVAFTQLVISEDGDTVKAPVPTTNGVGEIPFFAKKGESVSAVIHISAVTKTRLNNRYITSAEYKVNIHNR